MSPTLVTQRMPMGRFHGQRSQEWRTPAHVYAALDAEFQFTLDPCQPGRSDGLTRSWAGERVFCNPPYRRGQIERWLAKAPEAICAVYLVPARTGAAWWHEFAPRATEIRFVRGRLRFGGSTINAPEWSCILIFGGSSSARAPENPNESGVGSGSRPADAPKSEVP